MSTTPLFEAELAKVEANLKSQLQRGEMSQNVYKCMIEASNDFKTQYPKLCLFKTGGPIKVTKNGSDMYTALPDVTISDMRTCKDDLMYMTEKMIELSFGVNRPYIIIYDPVNAYRSTTTDLAYVIAEIATLKSDGYCILKPHTSSTLDDFKVHGHEPTLQ